MPNFRRIGRHGRAVPIVGRRARICTVVCRVCRRFGPGMGGYQAEANERCEAAGWTELDGEYGLCLHCKMVTAILNGGLMTENDPTRSENDPTRSTGEVSARLDLPDELADFETAAAKAKWELIADAPTALDSKFYRGTAEGNWSFTVASFDIPNGGGVRGYDGAVVRGPFVGHVPPDAAQRLFELAVQACNVPGNE
jgi:hypothetical protein